jgi:signal transduction histidine kinase
MPRAALDAIADEANATRIRDLSYKPGAGVNDVTISSLGRLMLPALRDPDQANQLFVDHLMLALGVHIAQTYGGMQPVSRPIRCRLAPWQERRAKEILRANLRGGVPLKEVAQECGLPEAHFLRAFRRTLGVTPHDWLIEQRIVLSEEELRDDRLPLTDVAAECDFCDQSHFERKRAEEAFREAQMELAHANRVVTMGQLTASIVHEVKQPLAAAAADGKAGLNWLTRSAPEIEEAKECVESSLKSIDRAVQIIERIHQLARKTSPGKQRLEVNEAIVEAIELVRGEILKNGVTIRTELADCLPPIQGDRVQFQQVILNLIINSVQAMSNVNDGKRELAVATGLLKPGGSVQVTVRDSGPGLSVENIERLFQPFYTTKPDGMGMGLSICRKIIEDHGGRLWASANVPCGAMFQLALPPIANTAS